MRTITTSKINLEERVVRDGVVGSWNVTKNTPANTYPLHLAAQGRFEEAIKAAEEISSPGGVFPWNYIQFRCVVDTRQIVGATDFPVEMNNDELNTRPELSHGQWWETRSGERMFILINLRTIELARLGTPLLQPPIIAVNMFGQVIRYYRNGTCFGSDRPHQDDLLNYLPNCTGFRSQSAQTSAEPKTISAEGGK